MKWVLIAAAAVFYGCAPEPTDPTNVMAPPKFGTLSGGPGEQANSIIGMCGLNARALCPSGTIKCDAYRRAYIKGCALNANVPPEYLMLMLQ